MPCDKFKKYIICGDFEELPQKDRLNLLKHLESCPSCKSEAAKMEEYKELIKKIKNTLPTLSNPEELTSSIMKEISPLPKESKKTMPKPLKKQLQIFTRAVASIALLFIFSFYYQQRKYINDSLSDLHKKHERSPENKAFIKNYNECLESSERLYADFLATNKNSPEFFESIAFQPFTPGQLNKLASNACQQAFSDYANANPEEKKQIIIKSVKSTLNRK